MAKCFACKKEMTTAAGCSFSHIKLNGRWVKRNKVTDYDVDERGRCYDCGAKLGRYHHIGCDHEKCPICGLQIIGTCDCEGGEEFATGVPEE